MKCRQHKREDCSACEGKPRWQQAARDEASNEKTERLSVPGGWLYRTQVKGPVGSGTYASRVAMVFVPEAP